MMSSKFQDPSRNTLKVELHEWEREQGLYPQWVDASSHSVSVWWWVGSPTCLLWTQSPCLYLLVLIIVVKPSENWIKLSKQVWARKLNSRSKIHTEASRDPGIHRESQRSNPAHPWPGKKTQKPQNMGEGLVFKSRLHFKIIFIAV